MAGTRVVPRESIASVPVQGWKFFLFSPFGTLATAERGNHV